METCRDCVYFGFEQSEYTEYSENHRMIYSACHHPDKVSMFNIEDNKACGFFKKKYGKPIREILAKEELEHLRKELEPKWKERFPDIQFEDMWIEFLENDYANITEG